MEIIVQQLCIEVVKKVYHLRIEDLKVKNRV
jgi:hypothetical protein